MMLIPLARSGSRGTRADQGGPPHNLCRIRNLDKTKLHWASACHVGTHADTAPTPNRHPPRGNSAAYPNNWLCFALHLCARATADTPHEVPPLYWPYAPAAAQTARQRIILACPFGFVAQCPAAAAHGVGDQSAPGPHDRRSPPCPCPSAAGHALGLQAHH